MRQVSIPGADQKDRGLWGRECVLSIFPRYRLGVVNGLSKNARLAKFKPNSRGLVVSYFYEEPSRSLDFVFNAKEVSGSQKMYQSRRLAKSRIYHSTPLRLFFKKVKVARSFSILYFNESWLWRFQKKNIFK